MHPPIHLIMNQRPPTVPDETTTFRARGRALASRHRRDVVRRMLAPLLQKAAAPRAAASAPQAVRPVPTPPRHA